MTLLLKLSKIFFYPIKSLGGISVSSAIAESRGIKYDRRYLLVDEDGVFLTQRKFSQMALLKLSFTNDGFKVLNTMDNSHTIIPLESDSTETITVTVWDDVCNASRVGKDLDTWFSRAIGKKCFLVYMPDNENRMVERKYINEEHIVSFADAYPYLLIGQSSLDDLNTRLEARLPINRFRPNFVFTGRNPYEEDTWKDFRIGNVEFTAVKSCARCVITAINQETAERGCEPLKTLSEYRTINHKIMFGMNLICKSIGKVSVNDSIKLIS